MLRLLRPPLAVLSLAVAIAPPIVAFMLRTEPTAAWLSRSLLRRVAVAFTCIAVMVCGALAQANALDGVLEVRSAYVNIDNGVFLLHARVEYPVNPAIADALRDG